jgi:hypothetical protein
VTLAQSAKQTHEQVAATMDRLAECGGPHAQRRRQLAERSRRFAEMEAQHIAAWATRQAVQRKTT